MNNSDWIKRSEAAFINVYSRFPAVMTRGRGCRLWDADGREYLDFLAGIAVCALGHCHPAVHEAICRQAGELVHVSNLFHTQPQIELAELLIEASFADKVFFANSGAEANEAAIKLARIHGGPGRFEIISLGGSFHGRTLATVAATGQARFHQGFEPLPQGFIHAPFGDAAALEALITAQTCAVLCEPIQGESGVRPLSAAYLAEIRDLCNRHQLALIFDEVQTGLGRTGTLFAHEQLGVVPDIMTLAKGLGNGLPIGAMLTTDAIASSLPLGAHASTFGGNPVTAAAALAVMRILLQQGFLAEVRDKGSYFATQLHSLIKRYPQWLSGVRGAGLLLGMTLSEAGVARGNDIVKRLFAQGCIINFAGNAALRFAPPLVVSKEEIDAMIKALDHSLATLA